MFGIKPQYIAIPMVNEDLPSKIKLLEMLNSKELRDLLRQKISEKAGEIPKCIAAKHEDGVKVLAGEINVMNYFLFECPGEIASEIETMKKRSKNEKEPNKLDGYRSRLQEDYADN